MAQTLAESLTEQFYAWEKRGRGWQAHDHRVRLEPAFVPFTRHLPALENGHDDGRKPQLWERVWKWWRSRRQAQPIEDGLHTNEDEPIGDDSEEDITEIQVRLPTDTEISGELADQLLLAVAAVCPRTSFELVSVSGSIVLQYAIPRSKADAVRRILEAYVPDAVLANEPVLRAAWEAGGGASALVDFGLRNEFMLPLPVRRSLSIDPLLGLIAALEGLREFEIGLLQVLFQAVRPDWAVNSLRAMSDGEGHAFFADAPETLALTREKLSRPLLACVVRVAAQTPGEERAREVAKSLGRALLTVYSAGANDLIPLDDEAYGDYEHEEDILDRCTHRSGLLLSSAELSGVVHLPAAMVEAEDLRAHGGSTKAAPASLHEGEVMLGENVHKGRSVAVRLRSADRMRHMHLIGATGTGKSTLLRNLIRQDLESGRGVALLDPHGDLADEVLALVPESRQSKVVLFDPADEDFPVGFNVLDAHSDRERELLSSDLVGVFRRFATSWGDQMSAVLGNAVMAFLESKDGGSLLDLRRFLMDKDVRTALLSTVDDPLVTSFWREEFPRLAGRPQMPIITRLDAFLRPKCIRNIVSQRQSRFDLGKIMDSGGIFIARLSQGAIGEQNAYLLGSLLVAKFQQAAMARERQAEADRRPFYLYLDEFHHFITPSISAILSGTRKYRLGLVLAHQELRQLCEHDIRSAVLANAGTRICFQIGDEDARTLAAGFRAFAASDLMSLGVGEAVCRIGQADQDFNLRCPKPERTDEEQVQRRRAMIRAATRERFALPRADVEASIAAASAEKKSAVETGSDPSEAVQPTRTDAVVTAAKASAPAVTAGEPALRSPLPAAPSAIQRPYRAAPRGLGKGGPEHKYLQSLIKSYAESRGFRATIEAPAVGGGSIDVLLVRGMEKVACEISVTTEPDHECANVRKCLASGATRVAVFSRSAAGLKRIQEAVHVEVSSDECTRVRFLAQADVTSFLDDLGPAEPDVATVRGYKVKTTTEAGTAPGKSAVGRTIAQALRRIRRK